MKNVRARILVLCAVVVAGVLAMIYFTREPSADGRTLSEWLRLAVSNTYQGDSSDISAALRKIGVKGIPILLEKMRAHDPAWKRHLAERWGRKIFPDHWFNAAELQRCDARYGFSVLGTQAVSAIPELSKMLFDTNTDTYAGQALCYIGFASVPVLREGLTNRNHVIRLRVAEGLIENPEMARVLLPEVLTLRQEANLRIPIMTLRSVLQILEEDELLPVTVEFLHDSRPQIQYLALDALGSVQTNRAVVVPLVLPFLTNSDPELRSQASNTLSTIAPAIATAHGVNTNALWWLPR